MNLQNVFTIIHILQGQVSQKYLDLKLRILSLTLAKSVFLNSDGFTKMLSPSFG